jgi:hypothetical protein
MVYGEELKDFSAVALNGAARWFYKIKRHTRREGAI